MTNPIPSPNLERLKGLSVFRMGLSVSFEAGLTCIFNMYLLTFPIRHETEVKWEPGARGGGAFRQPGTASKIIVNWAPRVFTVAPNISQAGLT